MFLRGPKQGPKYLSNLASLQGVAAVRKWRPLISGASMESALLQRRSLPTARYASSSSSKRWQTRQGKDQFAINAKVQGLKSRAAFKLLEVSHGPICCYARLRGLIMFARSMRSTRFSDVVRQWLT